MVIENVAGVCFCSMRIQSSTYVTTRNSIVLEHFGVDSRKCIKTAVWTLLDRCVFND